jgi:hypothetical protein
MYTKNTITEFMINEIEPESCDVFVKADKGKAVDVEILRSWSKYFREGQIPHTVTCTKADGYKLWKKIYTV